MKQILLFIFIFLALQSYAKPNIKLTSEFCEALGMLSEYIGRFNYYSGEPWNDSIVESFYANESELSEHFLDLIKAYEKETGNDFELYKSIDSNGNIDIYSRSLSGLINSLYTIDTFDSFKLATLNRELILNESRILKYAYLKGVYSRYGYGNKIIIANGSNKIRTINSVMESLNFNELKIYKTNEDYTPTGIVLSFKKTRTLQKLLNMTNKKYFLDPEKYNLIEE